MKVTAIVAAVALLDNALQTRGDVIYTSNVLMDMEWTTSTAAAVESITAIYSLETAVATFISDSWNPSADALINGKPLLSNVMSVVDQSAVSSNLTVVNSTVTLLYAAKDGQAIDVAAVLTNLVTGNLLLARVGGILGSDVKTISLMFANNGTTPYPYEAPKGCNASKGLITACIILSLCVVFVSGVLLWVAGGWYQIRQSMRDLMRYNTEDKLPYGTRQQRTEDEDDDSPSKSSGIIGANPVQRQNHGRGGQGVELKLTPGRGLYADDASDMLSPMSQQTDVTDNSRPPLGIKSISKLTREVPPDQRRERPHYAIRDERDYQER